MCPSVETVAAGNRLSLAECVTKTIQFSFFPVFLLSEQLLDVLYTGRREEKTDGVTVGEQSILALIKMGLEIHVWQKNYKLGIPEIKQDKQ